MPEMIRKKWLPLFVLCMGGGSIYILPYLNAYFYIPMKDAMHLTNTQIGQMSSAMGITAMIFYWPGGWIADRFSPRKLLTFSLLINGLLGFWLAAFPPFKTLVLVEFLMGTFLTVTYWSALIKATRFLAGADEQGKFFGILEGGRNLCAGAAVAIGLFLFAKLGSSAIGLKWTIIFFGILLIAIGILTWFTIPDTTKSNQVDAGPSEVKVLPLREGIVKVVKLPAVWLVTVIILCVYMTSIGITYLTPYATDVYKQSVIFGGMLYTIMQWSSVIASPVAGLVADKFTTSKTTFWLCIVMGISLMLFVKVQGGPNLYYFLLINSIVIGCSIYALRGIYYALLEEGSIPLLLTGTATGLISLIAYSPDIFVPLLAGKLLDQYAHGGLGYKYFFSILSACSFAGAILTLVFRKYTRKKRVLLQTRRVLS
jgi:sugar phosphate permease